MTNEESWLCAILHCGVADFSVIDCEYDKMELIETCLTEFGEINLNLISRCIVEKGCEDIQDAIDARIIDIEHELEEWECHENDEYCALLGLNPWEDIGENHNFLDTSVWFEKNEEDYRKYVPEAIDKFENDTGYTFG